MIKCYVTGLYTYPERPSWPCMCTNNPLPIHVDLCDTGGTIHPVLINQKPCFFGSVIWAEIIYILSGISNRRGWAVSTTCMVWIQTRPPTSISSRISASWKQRMIKAEIINCHSLSGWPLRNRFVIHSEMTGESPLGQVLATLLIDVWILQE